LDFTPALADYAFLIIFALLFASSGWLTASFVFSNRPAGGEAPKELGCLEFILTAILCSFAVTSFVLLLTAQAGIFRIRFWLVLLALYDLAVAILCADKWRRKSALSPWPCRWRSADLLLLPLAAFTFWIMYLPAEFIPTYRDPGEYVNIAVKLSESGALRFRDPDFAEFHAPEKQALFLSERLDKAPYPEVLPGFYLADAVKGELLPQFFHLYPLWLSLCFKLWRFEGLFLFNAVLGTLGVLLVVALAKLLFESPLVGLASGLLLACNAGQVWMSRSPFSEMLAQLFLLGGLLILAAGVKNRIQWLVFWAGVLFGLCLFVRVDSVLILAALAPLLVSFSFFARRWLLFSLAGCSAYALLHAWIFSFPYLINVFRTLEGSAYPLLWLGLLAGAGVALSLALKGLRGVAISRKARLSISAALMFLLGLAYLYGVLLRPQLNSAREVVPLPPPHSGTVALFNELNWVRLGWYLTSLGQALAFLGALLVVRRLFSGDAPWLLPFAAVFGVFAAFYLYKSRAFPDNYWVVRRYVEIVIPGCLMLACVSLRWLQSSVVRAFSPKTAAFVLALLYSFILIGEAKTVFTFWRARELAGVRRQLESLTGLIKDADVVLLEHGEFQEFFSGPLKFIFHKTVYPLAHRHVDATALEALVSGWHRQEKRVYMLASLEQTEIQSQRLRFAPKYRFELRAQVVEAVYDRLPRFMTDLKYGLQIYEVRLVEPQPPPAEITLNMDFNFGHEMLGFHPVEISADREAFRWTAGNASLRLQEIEAREDAVLTLRLGQSLPKGVASEPVKIRFNGKPVGESILPQEFQVFRHAIPRQWLNAGGRNLVELDSSTHSPAESLQHEDLRQLGIMVEGVKLQSLAPISAMDSLLLDLGSESDVLQADLRGFFGREIDGYRWTGKEAEIRFVAPLELSQDLRLWLRAVKSSPDPNFRQWLQVQINGQLMGRSELTGTRTEFKVYEFQFPQARKLEARPVLKLTVSPTWNPAQAGDSSDTRTLGCAVDWMKISGREY